ncbi:MAG: response regulator [Melioribacteraceae bacterium]|nr:response regulator [Melioribacteraceae bacterium]
MTKESNKNKILIVEDEFLTAKFFEIKLKTKNYDVLKIVATGKDAIESAITLKPDFILMDIRLEGHMDGIDAAKEILNKIDTKIIFISGYSENNFKEKLNNVNYLSFFSKPLDINNLIDVLKKC